jgi:hypothetical protein
MFDVPVDAWYVWVGLAVASVAVLGVVSTLPTAPPPDAASVAETVDRTAAAEYGATAEHPVDAEAVRLSPRGVGLRNGAGTTHASFAFEDVTPVARGTRLHAVLLGAPAASRFTSPSELARACATARARDPTWRPIGGPLVVRHLTWEGTDVTLVGY